jgi:hypothetical protein
MTLMLDPTQAADVVEDETQSIHAWSQADDAPTVIAYQPSRSWKLPTAVAVTAACAAIGAGTFLAWPQSAGKPLVAPAKPQVTQSANPAPVKPVIIPSPPVQPQSPDERFIALLKQRDVVVVSPPLVLNGGHNVCDLLSQGYTAPQIAEASVRSTPGTNLKTQATFVATAQEVYCPPNGNR